MKKKIFLADLTHTARGVHATNFPLGAAYVASYAQAALGKDFEIQLFKFPETLSHALITNAPVVMGLSNYSWNLEMGYKLSSWIKRYTPKLVVVFGGPNFPILASEKARFLKQRPAVDFYIQNEGELGFAELVKKLHEYEFDVKKMKQAKERIINCAYLDGQELIEGPIQRIPDINIVPSPYLSGILDGFFKFPLSPMIETTRGCPFSCTYCADGLFIKSKVVRFDRKRVKEELEYIREHVVNVDEIIITDLNFGMYDEDVTVAKYIAEIQKKYDWPVLVRGSAGKNNTKRIAEVASVLKGSFFIGSSLQSSDKEVLKNIKRNNISLESYQELLKFSKSLGNNAVTYSEVILGLPGDTKEKHFESLRYAIESGITNMIMYQACVLVGTEMASRESRIKYGLLTKFRVIPNCIGSYKFGDDAISIAEVEEIIVGGKNMTFKDYVSCRVMNLLIETYFNNALFEEIFSALRTMNVSVFDCLSYLHRHDELYTTKMKQIIESFIKATRDDLYDSYEEAQEYLSRPEIVEKHLSGELGINEILMHKTMLYLELEDISAVLLRTLFEYLGEKQLLNDNAKRYFEQLTAFVICRKQDFSQYDIDTARSFKYDFESIHKIEYKIDPRDIQQAPGEFYFKFFHDPDQKQHIRNCLNVYANPYIGISRMAKRSNLKKMYRKFEQISKNFYENNNLKKPCLEKYSHYCRDEYKNS